MDGRSRVSRGSSERQVGQSHAIIGTPWDVPVPRNVIFTRSGLDDARLLLRLDEAHAQVEEQIVEELRFRGIEIPLRLALQQRQQIDHLRRGNEIRIPALAAHRIRQIPEVHGGGGAERNDELREGDP